MKRWMSILLAALIMLTGTAAMQGTLTLAEDEGAEVVTEPAQQINYNTGEFELLEILGILPEDFDLDSEVTRARYAYMVAKILYDKINFEGASTGGAFPDVDEGHGFYNEIKILRDLNIISGDGTAFRPDESITYTDAVTILIKALSYAHLAEAKNGYPSGYLMVANQLGLAKGVSQSQRLIGNSVVRIIYNALFVNSVNMDSMSGGNISFSVNENSTVLNEYMGIREYDAIISNDGISSFNGAELAGDDRIVITDIKTNEELLLTAPSNEICLYFGCRMQIFIREHEDAEREIVYYRMRDENSRTVVFGHDVRNVSASEISYITDEYDMRTSRISLNPAKPPMVFINGVRRIDYTAADFMKDTVMITGIDNNDDRRADVLNVMDFDYNIITGNTAGNFINDKSEYVRKLDLNPEEARYRILSNENVKVFRDIKANDVISVAKSTKQIGGKNLYYLFVSRGTASGELEAKNTGEMTIDGKSYKLHSDIDVEKIEYGNVKCYLDVMGKIAYVDAGVKSRSYGFVLKAATQDEDFEAKGMVRIYTSGGTVETYNISKRVTKNNETAKVNISDLVDELNAETDDLIAYTLNAEGEIDNVKFAEPFDTDEKNNKDKFVYIRKTGSESYSGFSYQGIRVSNIPCFNINSAYEENGKGCSMFQFVTNQLYNGNFTFYDVGYDGVAGALLLKGDASTATFATEPKETYIFERMTDSIDSEGGLFKRIYYLNRGTRGSVIAETDAEHVALRSGFTTSFIPGYEGIEDLEFGDMFTFETNLSGRMNNFCVVYPSSKRWETPVDDGRIFSSAWGGTGTAREIAVFQGTLRYKTADNIVLRLNGPNFVAHPFSCSTDNKVYVLNMTAKTVRIIPLDELSVHNFNTNTPGQSIIIGASRHVLKEVIVYE